MTTFFKWLWRFNALGIAVLLISAALIGSWGFYQIITQRHVHNVIKTDKSSSVKDSYKLGTLQTWAKNKYGIAPLYLNQHIEESYYSKSSESNIVNYLFVHLSDGKAHWLFPHSNFLILKMIPLSKSSSSKTPPEAILYELVKTGAEKSQKLTANDPKTLAISQPDGSQYVELFSNILTFYDAQLTHQGDILLVFEDQKGFQTAVVHKGTLTIKHKMLAPTCK
ncbi:MAG TPA: hypothetical protein VNJ29_02225 [Candidatus Nitrosotenuis sp.]|jgi:hypothetical protein|nr:hypothetical protein [Candidatus Nitrosotenuis sp.]